MSAIRLTRFGAMLLAMIAPASHATAGDDPFADVVINYTPGSNPAPGYTNPNAALGEPARMTGLITPTAVVSPFNPAFGSGQIVSIGAGGSLTLGFNSPIFNHPGNPFGIDLIVFGNTGFIDSAHPDGVCAGIFGNDGGLIEVSANGVTWHAVPGVDADGLFPTLGYLDSGPYATTPGSFLSDFTRPVDPALRLADFLGLGHAQIVGLYEGSGGGTGIDIGALGLSQISFVRITVPPASPFNVEIDAVSAVAPSASPADFNGDGVVNGLDLGILLGSWSIPAGAPGCGGNIPCPADLNGDGLVNGLDLGILLSSWTI
jgi:hypothetical protein